MAFFVASEEEACRLEKMEGQAWICLYNILSTRSAITLNVVIYIFVDFSKDVIEWALFKTVISESVQGKGINSLLSLSKGQNRVLIYSQPSDPPALLRMRRGGQNYFKK
jgi:hypothetical protein